MEILSARGVEDLGAIQHRLHDVWLQLPEVNTTQGGTTVRLEGVDERSSRVPVRSLGPLTQFERHKAQVVLVVDHVTAVEIADDAQVGSLNLAKIWFDEGTFTLHIKGHIPVELGLRVERLDVRAEITDEKVASGRSWGLRPSSA